MNLLFIYFPIKSIIMTNTNIVLCQYYKILIICFHEVVKWKAFLPIRFIVFKIRHLYVLCCTMLYSRHGQSWTSKSYFRPLNVFHHFDLVLNFQKKFVDPFIWPTLQILDFIEWNQFWNCQAIVNNMKTCSVVHFPRC